MQNYQSLDEFVNNYPIAVQRDCYVSEAGNVSMWHEELEFKLFHTAGTQLIIGNQVYISEIDSVYIVNTCDMHSSRDSGYNSYDRLYIDISKIVSGSKLCATKEIEAISTGELRFRTHIKNNAVVNRCIKDLIDTYTGKEEDIMQTMGYLYLLLHELIRNETVVPEKKENQKHIVELSYKLSPAFSLINNSLDKPLTINMLATACNLSEKYFCVLFKQKTGVSCVEYINQLRNEKAKLLLVATNKSIASISEECGFSDSGYFSRQFKKQMGCTPIAFRKNKRL